MTCRGFGFSSTHEPRGQRRSLEQGSRGVGDASERRGAAAGDFISCGLGFGAVCRVKRGAVILDVHALDAWRASGHETGPLADPFCGKATGEGERGTGTASAPCEGYARGGTGVASVACISGGGLAGPTVKKLLGPMMLMANAKASRPDSLCGLDSL
jgi:hypothetical protein